MKTEIKALVKKIEDLSKNLGKIRIMHLCGTHEDTVTKYNIRSLLPKNIELLSGPGCPVCITPDSDLQEIFHLIKNANITLTTFGDMARVPFEKKSLFYYRSKGYDIRIVYSIFDALEIAKRNDKPVVHFAIGFETTMPSTALAILDNVENFYVYSSHRFFIPAMEALLKAGEIKIDGFINPGHVSTIVGVKAYEHLKKYRIPQVIAGFEPYDVILAIYYIIKALKDGINSDDDLLMNEYTRAVKYEGNLKAQAVINEVFGKEDWEWRGLGIIPKSGASIRKKYEDFDARKQFEDIFKDFQPKIDLTKKACRCGEVLRGLITPEDCPLFLKVCTPKDPVGPCMVSFEGMCNIWARYRGLY